MTDLILSTNKASNEESQSKNQDQRTPQRRRGRAVTPIRSKPRSENRSKKHKIVAVDDYYDDDDDEDDDDSGGSSTDNSSRSKTPPPSPPSSSEQQAEEEEEEDSSEAPPTPTTSNRKAISPVRRVKTIYHGYIMNSSEETLSREDLLDRIQILKKDLEETKSRYHSEKSMRKKKGRNILKLAKQFNLESEASSEKSKKIEELLKSKESLEAMLQRTTVTLEDLSEKSEQNTRDHYAEIMSMEAKHREICMEQDNRLTDLISSNSEQCKSLQKQLQQANLTTDHLRRQLANVSKHSLEGTTSTTTTPPIIVQRELKFGELPDLYKQKHSDKVAVVRGWNYVFAFFMILVVFFLPISFNRDLFSLDAMCAPCKPGTILGADPPTTLVAPWWAPSFTKETAFDLLCNGRFRAQIDWTGRRRAGGNNLFVRNMNDDDGTFFIEKRVHSLEIGRKEFRLTKTNGNIDLKTVPWSDHKSHPRFKRFSKFV